MEKITNLEKNVLFNAIDARIEEIEENALNADNAESEENYDKEKRALVNLYVKIEDLTK